MIHLIFLSLLRQTRLKFRASALETQWSRGIRLAATKSSLSYRPQRSKIYPLNLSISLSGGKESNSDSLSNGE